MKIIIIGCGAVGSAVTQQLLKYGHTITVIDEDERSLRDLCNVCDAYGIQGGGADVAVLKKAGASGADLLIATTVSDELNLLACIAAEKLGTKHTIARVRNPEYSGLVDLVRSDRTMSLTINPDLSVAKEIYRLLRFPSAAKINTFHRGRVELAEFAVAEGSPLCDLTLIELRKKLNMQFLVCAVARGGEVFIPSGDFRILAGDVIGVTVSEGDIANFFREIGAYKKPVKDVLISGGGRVTYYLGQMLKRGKIRATVIEKDRSACKELSEALDFFTVIQGDGTKQEQLLEEGIGKVDAFLALSVDDEENAIVSLFAQAHGTKKTVTLISSLAYDAFFRSIGLNSIVSPMSTTAADILRYIRSVENRDGIEIESLYRIMDERVEAIEFLIKNPIPGVTDLPLRDMKLAPGVLVACIVRDGEPIIPSGFDVIREADSVIVVAEGGKINRIKDILA